MLRSGRLATEQSVFVQPRNEGLHYAFWPAKGEYANVTEFVTDANASEELSFDEGTLCIQDLAIFSDGLERLEADIRVGLESLPSKD